jgi:hypothetical protein
MILNSRLPGHAVTFILIGVSSLSTLTAQRSASLLDQLTQRYTLTRVDPDGTVTQAGTVVSLGQYLLRANPVYGDRYQPNSYKKGRVSQPTFSKPSRDNIKLADSIGHLRFGEKVYITGIEVNDADVVLKLQTCAASFGRPVASAIYRAALSFQFQKGFVSSGNLKQIEDTISEALTIVEPGESSVGSTSQAPQTPTTTVPPAPQGGQQGLDIVHVGQTVEEVKALLGQPDKIENVTGKVVYSYTGLKVTFINGKVSDVQ